MAIRSDTNDKFAQPDGRFIGAPGKPTGVGYDASELRGARNVILDGLDHREVAFHKLAFAAMYEFITGQAAGQHVHRPGAAAGAERQGHRHRRRRSTPTSPSPAPRSRSSRSTPRPASARARRPVHRKTTGEDGLWGPFIGQLRRLLRVRAAHGGAADHPHLPLAVPALERRGASAARPLRQGRRERRPRSSTMSRPRGYFGVGRDKFIARRQGAARHQRRRARRLDRQARLRRPARAR